MIFGSFSVRAALRILAPAALALLSNLAAASPAGELRGPELLGDQAPLFERALSEMGITADDFKIDTREMSFYNSDKYRLPMIDAFFENPWTISPYTRTMTQLMLNNAGKPSTVVTAGNYRQGTIVRLDIPGYDALTRFSDAVNDEGVENLSAALGALSGRAPEDFVTDEYNELPPNVRNALTLFCLTLPEVLANRDAALTMPLARLGYDPEDVYRRVVEWVVDEPKEQPAPPEQAREDLITIEALCDNIDWGRLATGGTLFAHLVETIAATLTAGDAPTLTPRLRFEADTPYGKIVVGGAGKDSYDPAVHYLLIIDTGGNDSYGTAGATRGFATPASAVIDLGGDDAYGTEERRAPSAGAGIFGYGMVLDLSGDDRYECKFLGQGLGIFGCGVLCDKSGNDFRNAIGNVQGSGSFGTGVLIDNAGDDHYELYVYGQGYAFTKGVGVLLDCAGSDRYLANNTDIVYSGPHSPVINLNFAQGFGFGRRADLDDGHSWAGGVGMCIDGGGDDEYSCGIYALGGGYWSGIGICADKGGNDRYTSAHYTLAAPPHYALGIFQDDAGDDVYYGYLRQAIGHGRDFSLGWFEDSAGDDFYQGGNMSIGTGNIQSIGVVWDKGGDDTYLLYGVGLGQTWTDSMGSIRDFIPTIGLFIDGGGRDRYLEIPTNIERVFDGDVNTLSPLAFAGDGKTWKRGDNLNAPYAKSVGIDAG